MSDMPEHNPKPGQHKRAKLERAATFAQKVAKQRADQAARRQQLVRHDIVTPVSSLTKGG